MNAWYDLTKHKLRQRSGDHGGEAEGMGKWDIVAWIDR